MAPTDYDIGKQLAYYQRKYDLNPRSRVFAPLADLLRKSGRVQDALPLLERGLTEHPRYVSALVILGRCHLEIGNSRAAREAFRKVLQLDPDNLVVLKMLAEEAARQEKWSEATGLLERIVVLDPSDEPSENKLAQLRTQSSEGQFETFDEGSDQELDIQDIDDQEPDVQDIDDQEPDVQDIDSEAAGADVSEGEITPEEDVAAEPDLTPADEETT